MKSLANIELTLGQKRFAKVRPVLSQRRARAVYEKCARVGYKMCHQHSHSKQTLGQREFGNLDIPALFNDQEVSCLNSAMQHFIFLSRNGFIAKVNIQ